jgi:hypothetical protein
MRPIVAGVAGAVISGVTVYAVGAMAPRVDTLTTGEPALVQAVDAQSVPAHTTALRPVAAPSVATTPVRNTRRATTAARRPAERATVQEREVVRDERESVKEDEDDRSWGKTAMIIGGSAAGGAGVGGAVGGKKGALIGAAIGGGAASIYEATQRR